MSAVVESVCSRATAVANQADRMLAMGQTIDVSFLRPVTEGAIEVHAVARHRGRTTWVWDVDMTDDDGRLCASSRVVIAVRPR